MTKATLCTPSEPRQFERATWSGAVEVRASIGAIVMLRLERHRLGNGLEAMSVEPPTLMGVPVHEDRALPENHFEILYADGRRSSFEIVPVETPRERRL